jgi:hypothetical protein
MSAMTSGAKLALLILGNDVGCNVTRLLPGRGAIGVAVRMGGLTGVPVGFRGGGAPGRVGMSPRTMLPPPVGREGGIPGRVGGLTGAPMGRPMGGLVGVAPGREGVAPMGGFAGGVAGRPIGGFDTGLAGGAAGLLTGATGRGVGFGAAGAGLGAGVTGLGAAGFGAAGLDAGVEGLPGGGVGFLGPPLLPLRAVRSGSRPKGKSGCFRSGMIMIPCLEIEKPLLQRLF